MRGIENYIFLVLASCFLLITCRYDGQKHVMISILRCVEIDKDYHYCHDAGQESCYLDFGEKRYLKKDRLQYNRDGNIDSAQIFRSEGIVGYSSAELLADSLLRLYHDWTVSGFLEINGDSVVTPIYAKIHKVVDAGTSQQIYAFRSIDRRKWLYVIEIAK